MIPLLIIYTLRKFKAGQSILEKLLKFKTYIIKVIAVLFLLAFISGYSKNPTNSFVFNIVKNNDIIGSIKITESRTKDSVIYNIESKVEAQFILKFKVIGKEKYIYRDGTLIYSSLFRTINNKVKTNHCILYTDGQYRLQTPGKVSPLNFEDIKQNLVSLYLTEPVGITTVFCDNLQKMLKVKPMENGTYKVEFSKNKYNVFHYKNGRCIKIEAVSPMFDVTLVPVLS